MRRTAIARDGARRGRDGSSSSARTPRRGRGAALVALAGLVVAACARVPAPSAHHGVGRAGGVLYEGRDSKSERQLLLIARAFNDAYQQNRDRAVYARWDARSRAVISEAAYLRRHRECPNDPRTRVDTWGVSRGPRGAWLVHYAIDGQELTDWWYYVAGRFVFDLARSNPSAVALYRASTARYLALSGCGS